MTQSKTTHYVTSGTTIYRVVGEKEFHHQRGWILRNAKVYLKNKRVCPTTEKTILSKIKL